MSKVKKAGAAAKQALWKKPGFWLFLLLLVVVFALSLQFALLQGLEDGSTVYVTLNAQPYAEYPLHRDGTYRLEASDGYNLLVVKDGETWIEEADCSTHACMQMGKISRAGELIVCLPHGFVVEIHEAK